MAEEREYQRSEVPRSPEVDRRKRRGRSWRRLRRMGLPAAALVGCAALLNDGFDVAERWGWTRSRESHPVTPEARDRLVGELREALRDQELSPEERARLDGLAQDLAVASAVLDDLVARSQPDLLAANRRLAAGMDLVRRESYEAARSEFLLATVHDPGDAVAWTNLAEANRLTGRSRHAEEASARAVAAAPTSWLVRYNHGLLLAQLDRPDQALDHLEIALRLVDEPNSTALRDDLERNPAFSEMRRSGVIAGLFPPAEAP